MKVTENSALWRSFTEASTPSGSASIPQASLIEDKYHLMKGVVHVVTDDALKK